MVHTRSLCFHIDRLGKYSFRSGNGLADSAPFWLFSLQRAALSFAGSAMINVQVELAGSPKRPVG